MPQVSLNNWIIVHVGFRLPFLILAQVSHASWTHRGYTYNIGTTKPLEIAVPADQHASRKWITKTENSDLKKDTKSTYNVRYLRIIKNFKHGINDQNMSYEYTFLVSDKKIMVSTETMQMKSL